MAICFVGNIGFDMEDCPGCAANIGGIPDAWWTFGVCPEFAVTSMCSEHSGTVRASGGRFGKLQKARR